MFMFFSAGFIISTSEPARLPRAPQDVQLSHFFSLDSQDQRLRTSQSQISRYLWVGKRAVLKYDIGFGLHSLRSATTYESENEQYSSMTPASDFTASDLPLLMSRKTSSTQVWHRRRTSQPQICHYLWVGKRAVLKYDTGMFSVYLRAPATLCMLCELWL